MNARLSINLRDGIVEAEGTEDFVRSIYQDFKERIDNPPVIQMSTPRLEDASENVAEKKRPARASRKVGGTSDATKGKAEYKPKFNSNLNSAGLEAFYDAYGPKNHSEKILVFAAFVRDKLQISPCTADDIFTCYFNLKSRTKIPEAFAQAFHTAKARTHYIEFASFQEIAITIAGDNYLTQLAKK